MLCPPPSVSMGWDVVLNLFLILLLPESDLGGKRIDMDFGLL